MVCLLFLINRWLRFFLCSRLACPVPNAATKAEAEAEAGAGRLSRRHLWGLPVRAFATPTITHPQPSPRRKPRLSLFMSTISCPERYLAEPGLVAGRLFVGT